MTNTETPKVGCVGHDCDKCQSRDAAIGRLLADATRVAREYGTDDTGEPLDWTEWRDLRESIDTLTAREAEHTETIATLTATVERMRAALSESTDALAYSVAIFQQYALLHLDKGTADGNDKAKRNADIAIRLDASLKSACRALATVQASNG